MLDCTIGRSGCVVSVEGSVAAAPPTVGTSENLVKAVPPEDFAGIGPFAALVVADS